MKKVLKVFMILLMLAGIAVSILNFLPVKLNASATFGTWIQFGGAGVCIGEARDCCIVIPDPPKD